MKVLNEITVYEVDEVEIVIDRPKITIASHWNRNEFVVISIENKEYTVDADDFRKAIDNATNWKRW